MPINTSKYLIGAKIQASPGPSSPVGTYSPPPQGSGSPITPEELAQAKLRVKITRLLDDGLQTLGQMEILAEDEKTVLTTLATCELPYRGNRNSVSSIPPGKNLVRSFKSDHYGKSFWVYSNEAGGWQKNSVAGGGYNRQAILIHRAPTSSWLMGCIGPGNSFSNIRSGPQKINKVKYHSEHLSGAEKGNPYGTFPTGREGLDRMAELLWSSADVTTTSFYMTIDNKPGGLLTGEGNKSKLIDAKGNSIFIDAAKSP